MNRQIRRDNDRIIATVKKKAVKDMNDWLDTVKHDVTPNEVLAFKAGYIAGLNRGQQNSRG